MALRAAPGKRAPWLATALSAFIIAGCMNVAFEPRLELTVTTDRSSYQVGDTVRFEVRNDTDDDAFFFHCADRVSFVIEQRLDGVWTEHLRHGPICPAIYSAGVIVLIPGSAVFDERIIEPAGTFRVRYDTGPRSRSIGSVHAYSDAFTVTAVQGS
jgi:hypothetical protein